ncbi:MAG TPA: hypothetical protein VF736_13100 [Pyrinomonadaceae bacterium]|jgi:hypothetical protein
MKKTASKQSGRRGERPLTAPARKSPSPHGHPLVRSKPEDRVHPAERKAKHKRRPADGE